MLWHTVLSLYKPCIIFSILHSQFTAIFIKIHKFKKLLVLTPEEH